MCSIKRMKTWAAGKNVPLTTPATSNVSSCIGLPNHCCLNTQDPCPHHNLTKIGAKLLPHIDQAPLGVATQPFHSMRVPSAHFMGVSSYLGTPLNQNSHMNTSTKSWSNNATGMGLIYLFFRNFISVI